MPRRESEREIRRRVRALASNGFLAEPEAAAGILASPWDHLLVWLSHDFPTSSGLRPLLFHLKALSEERFFTRQIGVTFSAADYDALARQLAAFLADSLQSMFTRNRALEAMFHRDYEVGLRNLDQPREVARILGLLQVVESHIPWPDAPLHPELVTALDRELRAVDDAAFERDTEASARIVARLLRMLAQVWGGSRATITVPLGGAHPGVVRLTVSCALQPASDPNPRGKGDGASPELDARRVPTEWSGLPVAADVMDGMPDLLQQCATLLPDHVASLARVHVMVSEDRHRPLDRAVRLMAGRSWELGGLLALLAALTGTPLDRTAATGQVNVSSGQIEIVGEIDDKVEALFACRHPSRGPMIDRLFCPTANVGAAERAARRLQWEPEIRGLSAADELLDISGPDPWADYCDRLIERAEARLPELDVPISISDGLTSQADFEERVAVLPAPFGIDPDDWCLQLAAEFARARQFHLAREQDSLYSGARGNVPLILPADPEATTFSMLIADAVRAVDPRVAESQWSNNWQSPDGFVLIHADPDGLSPLLRPVARELQLSRRHPAMRHRFVFVAAGLHQLQEWHGNAILARL